MQSNKKNGGFGLRKKAHHEDKFDLAGRNGVNGDVHGVDIMNGMNGMKNGHSGIQISNIICFSHLRWDFVFQRPQHLLSRWAKEVRVFYFEEPIFGNFENNFLKVSTSKENANVNVLTPHLKKGYNEKEVNSILEKTITKFINDNKIKDYLLWYITPMALPFSQNLNPKLVVYDCMDELSCFKGAHPDMLKNEVSLLSFADVVFTGGYNLYEYKKNKHPNIHPFPSSIDQNHFESGIESNDPVDQSFLPHPRIGFYGVLDERLDIELINSLAQEMPCVHFIMIGPVVKIDQKQLPNHRNIHYLGQKDYKQLPAYLAHWDVAFLPFAKNESTRFISPTKTPEYLCAGKPVISTSIHDVVHPYGENGLVHIADNVTEFSVAIYKALKQRNDLTWQRKVKEFLKTNSWDLTWSRMKKIIYQTLEKKESIGGELKNIIQIPLNGHKVNIASSDTL